MGSGAAHLSTLVALRGPEQPRRAPEALSRGLGSGAAHPSGLVALGEPQPSCRAHGALSKGLGSHFDCFGAPSGAQTVPSSALCAPSGAQTAPSGAVGINCGLRQPL